MPHQLVALVRGLLPALLGMGALMLPASAATLNVPSGAYPTIQAAISTAASGDTVLLADGTYTGAGNVDVDFLGKNIVVTSQNGPTSTVIDCGGFSSFDGSGDHRGFILHSGETNAVICGLTIRNGYESGNRGDGNGGGINNYDAGLTVQNCVLTGNTASNAGGGLYTENDGSGAVLVTGCTVAANTASVGGGILNQNFGSGEVSMTGCTLTANKASFGGGGLYTENYGGGAVSVTDCTLTANSADNFGGGLINENINSGTISVTRCTLTANSANNAGGGVYNDSEGAGTVSVTDCTVTASSASEGGGIFNGNYGAGAVSVTNCTLTGNAAQDGNGGGLYNYSSGGTIGLTNDIVYGDTGGEDAADPNSTSPSTATRCDVQGGLPGGTADGGGNIDANPLFVSAASPYDLHLLPGSLCLGAGTSSGAPTTTLDGYTRPNPPAIGAYEEEPPPFRVYAVNATSAAGQTVLLSAALTRPGGVGLAGATLTFSVDGQPAGSAFANKDGDAGVHYAVPLSLSVGSHTLTASFAGDGTNPASSGTATLTVTKARLPNTVVTVGVRLGRAGATVVLKSTLKTPAGQALSGRTLTYTVNGVSAGSAVTDGTGLASLTYTIPAGTPAGSEPVVVSFAGDSGDSAGSGKGTLTVK